MNLIQRSLRSVAMERAVCRIDERRGTGKRLKGSRAEGREGWGQPLVEGSR
jgi:hypothetical protein